MPPSRNRKATQLLGSAIKELNEAVGSQVHHLKAPKFRDASSLTATDTELQRLSSGYL